MYPWLKPRTLEGIQSIMEAYLPNKSNILQTSTINKGLMFIQTIFYFCNSSYKYLLFLIPMPPTNKVPVITILKCSFSFDSFTNKFPKLYSDRMKIKYAMHYTTSLSIYASSPSALIIFRQLNWLRMWGRLC